MAALTLLGLEFPLLPAQAAYAAGTSAAAQVGTVLVQTIPSLSGVKVGYAGRVATTDSAGVATFDSVPLDTAAKRVSVATQTVSGGLSVRLYRVSVDPNHPNHQRRLLAELAEERSVAVSLETPSGAKVPPAEITTLTLTDNLGRTLTFKGAQLAKPIWLAALLPVQAKGGVDARLVTYSLQSVIVRGANVVNQGQLRLVPFSTSRLVVRGLFFDLTVAATDALAGSPAGTSVRLIYPDKSQSTVKLGPLHRVDFVGLPRGDYTVLVQAGVMNLKSPLRLSRDLRMSEKVVTTGDAGALLALLGGGAALLYGLGTRRRHRARAGELEKVGAP